MITSCSVIFVIWMTTNSNNLGQSRRASHVIEITVSLKTNQDYFTIVKNNDTFFCLNNKLISFYFLPFSSFTFPVIVLTILEVDISRQNHHPMANWTGNDRAHVFHSPSIKLHLNICLLIIVNMSMNKVELVKWPCWSTETNSKDMEWSHDKWCSGLMLATWCTGALMAAVG